MITVETATDIALTHRDIKVAIELLSDIEKEIEKGQNEPSDIRDNFGRRVGYLDLGVPSGNSSRRLFQVDWCLAKPVIEAHIAKLKSELSALNQKALFEAG